jgi:hypothetical protein
LLRRVAWLALLLLGSAALDPAAATPAELRIDVRAAWDGLTRPGRWTELSVSIVSPLGGAVALEARGSAVTTRVTGRVEAGVPAAFRLPCLAEEGVSLGVVGPDGREHVREVPLRSPATDRRVVAGPSEALAGAGLEAVLVDLEPRSFPSFARAFETLDALVLDAATLSGLSSLQLRAVRRYVAGCGRTLLLDVPANAARWRAEAGCDAVFLAMVGPAASRTALLPRLLEARGQPLPGVHELSRQLSLSRRHAAHTPLLAYFAVYLALLVLGGFVLQSARSLLVIPIASALLLLVGFSFSRPVLSAVAWTEATSGSSTARFVALVRVDGLARGAARLEIPRDLGPPDPPAGTRLRIEVDPEDPFLRVEVATHLLSRRALQLRGALPWTAPLVLERVDEDLRARNAGSAASAPGFLLRAGRVSALPPLAPGAVRSPSRSDRLLRTALPAWLARRVSTRVAPAILVADVPPALRNIRQAVHWQGWTLISAGEHP